MTEKLVKFADDGTDLTLLPVSTVTTDDLQPGTYTFAFSQLRGIWLTHCASVPDIEMKVYGDTNYRVQKTMNAFKRRKGNTGVLLAGEPGMGKSVFVKLLAAEAKKLGMPVIIIKQDFGPGMIDILAKIHTECLVIMDEFEKIFSGNNDDARNGDVSSQNKLLSLMDGMDSNKKLFVASVNDTWRVSRFMLNRPGRFFYHFEFSNLNQGQITEYLSDRLADKSKLAYLVTSLIGHKINYDSLAAIVEEINAGMDPVETLQDLNLDRSAEKQYDVRCVINGIEWKAENINIDVTRLTQGCYLYAAYSGVRNANLYVKFNATDLRLRGQGPWDEVLIVESPNVDICDLPWDDETDKEMAVTSIGNLELSPHPEFKGFKTFGPVDL